MDYLTSFSHCSKSSFFCPKNQLWFPEKIVNFFWLKNSWKCCGFGLFSCWQLWFHEKNCQKKFGRKTRENVADLESKINRDNLDYWHPGHPKSLTWSHIFVGVGSVTVLSIGITLLIDSSVCNFTRHFFWNKGVQTRCDLFIYLTFPAWQLLVFFLFSIFALVIVWEHNN